LTNYDSVPVETYILRDEIISKYKDILSNTLFLEFGVATGRSMDMFYDLYQRHDIKNVDFYGFDGWVGLPKETQDNNNPSYWSEGVFNERIVPCIATKFNSLDNIHIVDGMFENTLNEELLKKFNNKKVGVVHIDSDIYSSAVTALDFLLRNNLLQKGSIIMYDDWGGYYEKLGEGHDFECGEGKAHLEMMKKYNIKNTFLRKYIIMKKHYEITVFVVE
jgi:hypothetical protein